MSFFQEKLIFELLYWKYDWLLDNLSAQSLLISFFAKGIGNQVTIHQSRSIQ